MRGVGLLVLLVAQASGAPARRPGVDLQAMQEAMNASRPSDPAYPSAASYAHFLRARLAHNDGDHRAALDELRLALASDDSNPFLMTRVAEEYARLSDLDRAENQLKRVLEKSPDYASAQLLMGRVLYEAQKTTRARGHLQRAIKLRPQDADAYLVLTQLALEQERVDEAVKTVEDYGAAVPGDPIGYRRLGLALAERNDWPRAEKLLVKAVERDPSDVESLTTLAHIYEISDRAPRALEVLSQAVEHQPENKEALLLAGRMALRLKQKADARMYFDQLLALGKDPENVVKVAFSFLAAGQPDTAAEILDAQRNSIDEPRLAFYAGLVHERTRKWQRAADAFDAAAKANTDIAAEARLHRAMCLSQLGQHKASLEVFKQLESLEAPPAGHGVAYARALERAGQNREAELLLVRRFVSAPSGDVFDAVTGFYERQGRLQDALALFQGALTKAPQDVALMFATANVLEKQGNWKRAVETMRQVLVSEPENPAALNFIGYTLADHGVDLDEAERSVKKAVESKPESPSYLDSLGWVMLKKGDLSKANEFLEKAVDGAPEEPTIFEHLGDAAAKAGKTQRAQEAYQRALELVKANGESAERKSQKSDLEKKLKALSSAK